MRTKNENTVVVLMMVGVGSTVAEPPKYKLQVIDPVVEQTAATVHLASKRLMAGYSQPDYGLGYQACLSSANKMITVS